MDFNCKKQVRKYMLDKRDKCNNQKRSGWDSIIFNKFISSEYYKSAKLIFIFVSFRSEVDTLSIIKKAIEDGKTICVPKVISKEEGMKVFKISGLDDLESGYYEILEPLKKCEEISIKDIDLVVMPGAAFDLEGGRIGYGGGFYDRFLLKIDDNVKKLALAYKFQVLDSVPMDENDIRADMIITD